jgi:hypothetical protein
MPKTCDLCSDGGVDRAAEFTYYSAENTMTWCCAHHADSLIEEARAHPSDWVGSKLVPTIEETDVERHARLNRTNLIRTQLRAVS